MKKLFVVQNGDVSIGIYCKNKTIKDIEKLEFTQQYMDVTFRKIHNRTKEEAFTYYCSEKNIYMTLEFLKPNYYIINEVRKLNIHNGMSINAESVAIPSYSDKVYLKTETDGREIYMSGEAVKCIRKLQLKQHQISLKNAPRTEGTYSSFINDQIMEFHCVSPTEIVLVNIEKPDISNHGIKVVKNERS